MTQEVKTVMPWFAGASCCGRIVSPTTRVVTKKDGTSKQILFKLEIDLFPLTQTGSVPDIVRHFMLDEDDFSLDALTLRGEAWRARLQFWCDRASHGKGIDCDFTIETADLKRVWTFRNDPLGESHMILTFSTGYTNSRCQFLSDWTERDLQIVLDPAENAQLELPVAATRGFAL